MKHRCLAAPSLSRRQIVNQAERLIRSYFEQVGPDLARLGISFDAVYEEYIYPEFGIELDEDQELPVHATGEQCLGAFDPIPNRVCIHAELSRRRDPRREFTGWHEIGHAILHGEWLRRELRGHAATDVLLTTESMLSPAVESALERQANLFASHAAAPDFFVEHAIVYEFGIRRPLRYIGPGDYSFVARAGTLRKPAASFTEFCTWVAICIRRWFGKLSVEALSYRVAESKCVLNLTAQTPAFRLHRVAPTMRSGWRSMTPIGQLTAPR